MLCPLIARRDMTIVSLVMSALACIDLLTLLPPYHCLHHTPFPIRAQQEVKISAAEIVENLHYPNGTAMIPPGSLVYISTDDPDGLCKNCLVNRQPCNTYKTPKPPGCPEDVSCFCGLHDVCTEGGCVPNSDDQNLPLCLQ